MSAVISESLPVWRPMRHDDLEAVLEIECAAYEHPWTEGIFTDCLRVGYYCVVCELDDRLVGHGVMSMGVRECHLLNICVHPDYQRRGLGACMVNYLLDVAHWKRAKVAFLEVRVSNTVAYHLYNRMGFEEIGVRRRYYPNGDAEREDALILSLELGGEK